MQKKPIQSLHFKEANVPYRSESVYAAAWLRPSDYCYEPTYVLSSVELR